MIQSCHLDGHTYITVAKNFSFPKETCHLPPPIKSARCHHWQLGLIRVLDFSWYTKPSWFVSPFFSVIFLCLWWQRWWRTAATILSLKCIYSLRRALGDHRPFPFTEKVQGINEGHQQIHGEAGTEGAIMWQACVLSRLQSLSNYQVTTELFSLLIYRTIRQTRRK